MIEQNPATTSALASRGVPTLRMVRKPNARHTAARMNNVRARCACSGEDCVVTAPQMRPPSESVDRAPWGEYHLKVNGGFVTLCGQSTLTWRVFWTLRADPFDPMACSACLQTLRLRT